MSLNNTFKYHFTLRKEKKNKLQKCPIYLRILVNGKRSSISTNQYIKESFWLGGIKKPTKDKELNKVLKSIERKLINTYNRLINLDKEITCRSIKDELIGKKKKIHTIISAFEFHNKNMESLLGTKYAWGTYKNYRSTLKTLKQFIPKYYNVKDIQCRWELSPDVNLFFSINRSSNLTLFATIFKPMKVHGFQFNFSAKWIGKYSLH